MALALFDAPSSVFSRAVANRAGNPVAAGDSLRIHGKNARNFGAAIVLSRERPGRCVCSAVDDECSSQAYGSTMTSIDAQAQVSACASATSHRCSILQDLESHVDETFTFVFKPESAVTVTVSLKDALSETFYEVLLSAPLGGLTLHWAVNNWSLPSASWWPSGTVQVTDRAIETPFTRSESGSWEISMKIPELEVPRCLVFVLKDTDGAWYNNNGCFQVPLKCFELNDLMEQVILSETTFDNWSLFNRFILASELVDAAEEIGANGMAFMYTWLRFSALKQLTWYRKCNYQSKDIAYVQERLASLMAEKAARGKDLTIKKFARLILSTLPRGGGDADQIRMGILNIMRENGIREGHRPGIEDHFLEQWHQKLHTNTSSEDIHICEAYLHFLRTNNMDNFYQTLWNNGRISKEWIETMDHPITGHPVHLPHLIPAFQHFLWILKTVHSGADLDVMAEMSKGYLDDETKSIIYNILGNRDAWWIPGELVKARKKLEKVWRGGLVQRDVMLLDIALNNFFGLSIGRIDKSALRGDDLCELLSLVLENCCIDAESEELNMCLKYWNKVKAEPRWTSTWALLAMSAADRIALSVEDYMDHIYKIVQPNAEILGKACGIAESYIKNFGEEVVRGQVLFNISGLLQRLQSILRGTAGLSTWQVVSHQPSAVGKVVVLPTLSSIQGLTYSEPHVVLTEKVDGMEDIPVGVTAVLCASTVDMLSHVAIRARDSQVLLSSCFSSEEFGSLKSFSGQHVLVNIGASGQVLVSECDERAEHDLKAENCTTHVKTSSIKNYQLEKLVLSEDEFEEGKVGAKSIKISMMRKALDKSVLLPPSIALPLGVFESVMNDPINSGVNSPFGFSLQRLKATTDSERIPTELARIRGLVRTKLTVPKDLKRQVTSVAEACGLIPTGAWENEDNWEKAWQAICQVWSSKWTDRAWLSRRAHGIPDEALFMGCLIQKVIATDYAFVIHTMHPIAKDPELMFCEIVPGLGEVLVGNHKGSAFSFTVPKSNLEEARILSLPSKRVGLFAAEGTVIARSDSNGEDLEGFSGAGLYDSVTVDVSKEVVLDYSEERLIWDHAFRGQLLKAVCQVGINVEAAFNGQPQDIEGVYSSGNVAIVQSRPQILN
ncbi:alpha-glucan water dikinase 2 [Selaginella moellendorffii]|uniref:alpha-glucan water dikinase 2 n=1 Tax=Selaginella moellendorffii TaxID=88036 RepID=UPI000D1C2E87|nr:alpha-glucan water dikinase 2 [Selaginella moellendorffii]|eukprot:XP_024523543.1 alpha-glucan water dikinase 2 [Selaginella moellendorffii]